MGRPRPDELKGWLVLSAENEQTLDSATPQASGSPEMGSRFKRSFWALSDQACASIGNFATNILVANHLTGEEYGAFALINTLLFTLSSFHGALVVYPVSFLGARQSPDDLRKMTGAALILSTLMAIPLMIAIAFMGQQASGLLTAFFAIWALLCFLWQETLRRSLMAGFRFAGAVPGDAIRYLGQACVIGAMAVTGYLTVPYVLAALAFTSLLAAIFQCIQMKPKWISPREAFTYVAPFWKLGKWLAASNITTLITANAYGWMLWYSIDKAASGSLEVVGTVVKLSNPIVFGLVGVLVPTISRVRHEFGTVAAKRVGLRYMCLGAVVVYGYFAVVLIAPEFVLGILFPKKPEYKALADELRIFTCSGIIGYTVTMLLAIMNGLGHSRPNLISQLGNVFGSILIGLPLTYYFGLWGCVVGGFIATVFLLIICLQQYFAFKDQPPDKHTPTPAGTEVPASPAGSGFPVEPPTNPAAGSEAR